MPLLARLESLTRKNSLSMASGSFAAYCVTLLGIVASALSVASAQTAPLFPIFPKYKVLGVVYAPPGSASFVTYGDSTLVGSSSAMTTMNSSTNVTTTSSTNSGFLGLFGGSTTQTWSDGWMTAQENSSSVALTTTKGNSITTMGPISSALGVNHDNDIIYIWLNPVVSTAVTYTAPSTFAISWTGLSSNSCDMTDSADTQTLSFYQLASGCDPNQFPSPDIIGIPVWCLKNPYWPGQGCAQWLPYTSRYWDNSLWLDSSGRSIAPGLTMQDYADILQADPFVAPNGLALNVCHPSYGPDLDPNDVETVVPTPLSNPVGLLNPPAPPKYCVQPAFGGSVQSLSMSRFQPYGTVEYPVPGPNGLPQTYTGTFNYSQTNTNVTTAIDSHTTSYSQNTTVSFGTSWGFAGFPIAAFNLSTSNGTQNSQTWQHQNSITNTTQLGSTASYSITGPQLSDNYTGPATYNVYLDNVYGTYAFYSALEPKPALGNITISASPTATVAFPSFGQLTASLNPTTGAVQAAYLTNNSPYPLTMVGPAVTFSDPGFQIANNGNDNCSNQVLQPNAQCRIDIEFAPVVPDAPNNRNNVTTYPVNATLIAAGTENASSPQTYQNILVTNQAAVTGVAAVGATTEGATLLPAAQNASQPNAYVFGQSTYVAQTESFTFKNYYSANVTFPPFPNDIILSDGTNFTILNDTQTGGCSGAVVTPGNTCTFTLQFLPVTLPQPSGLFTTRITAMGQPANAAALGLPAGNITLAFAGAAGTALPAITLTPATLTYSFSAPSVWKSLAVTIKNNTSFTINNLSGGSFDTGNPGWEGSGITHGPVLGGGTANCPGTQGLENASLPAGASCTGYVEALAFTAGSLPAVAVPFTGTLSNPSLTAVRTTVTATGNAAAPAPAIAISGAEQTQTVTTPAKYGKATVIVSGAVSTPFTGVRHLSLTVGGFKATASYDQTATSLTVAKALTAAASASGSPVKATVSGDTITLKSKTAGAVGNLAFAGSNSGDFTISPHSSSLTGGADEVTTTKYDGGTVNVTVGSVSTSSHWGQTSTPQTIAVAIAAALNSKAHGAFTAIATGDTITFTVPSGASGSTPNVTVNVNDTKGFTPPSFVATTGG